MAKSPIDGSRVRLAAGRVRGIAVAVSAACLATAHFAAFAQIKQPVGDAELLVPLCTDGTLSAKSGEDALGLYALGGGQHMVDWTDADSAKNCAKGTPAGLRLNVDNVSLGLAKIGVNPPLVVYSFSGGVRQFQVTLQEPAICESYATEITPLKMALSDTNADALQFNGVESLSYSLASGGIAPILTQAAHGPFLRCHAVTAPNAALPNSNSLFDGGFESSSDLRVEFLDAQGVLLAATSNDQFVQQPIAFPNGITYQVRVTNAGDGPATGVRVREFAPLDDGSITPKVDLSGCGPNPVGSELYCSGGNGLLFTDIATLQPGASQVYTLTRKALATGALTSVAAFSNPETTSERAVANNARSLRINLINNQAPQAVGSIANLSKAEGESLNIATAANFSDPEGATLTYSATNLPAGISINTGTGLITGLLGFNTHAVYNVVVTANDGSLTVNQPFTLTVTDANGAPTVAAALPDVTRSEGQLLNIQTASGFIDPDGDALVYTITGLPGSPVYDPATGQIFYSLDSTSAGVHEVTVSVTDGNLTADQTFTLTVNNVNETPTIALAIEDQSSEEGQNVSLDIAGNFADSDEDDTLTFSVTAGALPPGLTLSPAGLISGDISHTGVGSYSVTITANDGNGGTVSAPAFDWEVSQENAPPVAVGSISAQTATEGAVKIISHATINKFSDPDDVNLIFSVDGLPAGLEMPDGANGDASIAGIPGPGTAGAGPGPNGEYEVTVTAEDSGGQTATQEFLLTINAP